MFILDLKKFMYDNDTAKFQLFKNTIIIRIKFLTKYLNAML